MFWSGNFIVGKFATLFEIPPLTLNFYRWLLVWIILIPFTFKEILLKKNYIKVNKYALLVQLVERRFPKPDVEGSSPSGRV